MIFEGEKKNHWKNPNQEVGVSTIKSFKQNRFE